MINEKATAEKLLQINAIKFINDPENFAIVERLKEQSGV